MKLKYSQLIVALTFLAFSASTIFAQSERDKGIELYQKGSYRQAVEVLKKVTKSNSSDAQSWSYLGLSYLKNDNPKDAIKAFKKAVGLNDKDAVSHFGLAYAYLLRNNLDDAQSESEKSLALNSKNAEAYYVLGIVYHRRGSYSAAYERANKALQLNPNLSGAHLLRAETLISSFVQQAGTVVKPVNSRSEILTDAAESLEKYLSQQPANETTKFYQQYLESVKFYSNYYKMPENQTAKISDPDAPDKDDSTSLKILAKPRPAYTDAARQSGIQGVIRLMVGFDSDGTVKHILVVKPLSHGLNEQAVRAARQIKFEPATQNGKPVSVVKQIEYSFSIY